MTTRTTAQILQSSITNLGWFNVTPHRIDQVIGLHAEATRHQPRMMRHGMTNEEIIASISGGGGGSTSGHADPTATAALWGEPDAVDDLGLGAIDAALDLILGTAVELDHAGTDAIGQPRRNPPLLPGRDGKVQAALGHLHHAQPNLTAAEQVDPGHIRFLVATSLDETVTWLHDKAVGIWRTSRGDTRPVAEQRNIVECSCCSKWRKGTIAIRKGLCDQCATFQDAYKARPTESIVRRWEHGHRNATPSQILEAKAPSRRRRQGA